MYEKILRISPGAGNKIRQWDFEKYSNAKKLREKNYNILFFFRS